MVRDYQILKKLTLLWRKTAYIMADCHKQLELQLLRFDVDI